MTISKNQIRSASVKFLHENINYIFALISYSCVISSLSYLAKVSYAVNNFSGMLIVTAFVAILIISKSYLLSAYGLRNLK